MSDASEGTVESRTLSHCSYVRDNWSDSVVSDSILGLRPIKTLSTSHVAFRLLDSVLAGRTSVHLNVGVCIPRAFALTDSALS